MHLYNQIQTSKGGLLLNNNRNNKINQMTEDTLVIGIDIAKNTHYACALDDRGRELQRPIGFHQSLDGFKNFHKQVTEWLQRHKKPAFSSGLNLRDITGRI